MKAYWAKGGANPLVELPTGAGKSAVLASLCHWLVQQHGARVAVVTHRKELIAQDAEAIRRLWPMAPVGIYSAGLGRKESRQITVGGVQSLVRRPGVLGKIDVMIVDEAHLVAPKATGQYGQLIAALKNQNQHLRLAGLTATPYRLGQGMLTHGEHRLFDSIVYRVGVKRLIEEGFLSPVLPGKASAAISLDGVRTSQGEYVARDLELAADVDEITDKVASDLAQSGRKHCLVFSCGVQHAAHLRNAIRMAGVSAEMVTGDTPSGERARYLAAFKEGKLNALVNCDVLTTGFDAPLVDGLFVVRATQSPALWVQIVGRGLRKAPGKRDCVVYDYGSNVSRLGPIDDVKITRSIPGEGKGPPMKGCPSCDAEVLAARRVCPHCDYEWPKPERSRKATAEASGLDVVSGSTQVVEIEERKIVEYISTRSEKKMLRVDYFVPNVIQSVASEFVCLEHAGSFARRQAEAWWRIHSTMGDIVPQTVEDALGYLDTLRTPRTVRIKKEGKYAKVIGYGFPKGASDGDDDIPF